MIYIRFVEFDEHIFMTIEFFSYDGRTLSMLCWNLEQEYHTWHTLIWLFGLGVWK